MLANTDQYLFFFIVACFAVWRLSSLFATEDGPFNLFRKIRVIVAKVSKPLWDGLICMWCNSVWFSMILAILFAHNLIEWFILLLGMSAISILIEKMMTFLSNRRV